MVYLVVNYPRLVSGLVHPSDLHGISRVNPLITGVITHLLSGMNRIDPENLGSRVSLLIGCVVFFLQGG